MQGEVSPKIENDEAIETSDVVWKFWRQERYMVVFMISMGFFNIYSIRVCLSVAIVAMTKPFNVTLENGTVIEDQHFDWNSKQQGLLLSSFFYGFISTQILGGVLASKFGGYYVFLCGIGGSSLMALLAPVAASTSIYLLMSVRIIEGLFEAVTLPSMHALLSRWAPIYERSRMASFCLMGIYSGILIAMPLSGVLASNLGWKSVFYCFGCSGVAWCILWVIFISPYPTKTKPVQEEEMHIVKRKRNTYEEQIVHPWNKILTSTAVWAIVASNFTEAWAFNTLFVHLPTFLSDVLKYEVQKSGIVLTLPYLTRTSFLVLGGYLADWCQIKGYLTTRQVRQYFNCGAFMAMCSSLLLAAFMEDSILIVLFLALTAGFGGLSNVGYMINPLDLAPNHASIIYGISNTIASLGGIISPILTGVIVTDKTKEQWQIVFFIIVALNLVGCLIYWFLVQGELQPWAVSDIETMNMRTSIGYTSVEQDPQKNL